LPDKTTDPEVEPATADRSALRPGSPEKAMNPEALRESILRVLRELPDPRGAKATELLVLLNADQKARHRIRRVVGELIEEGVIERGPNKRYQLVGWAPKPAVPTPASARPTRSPGRTPEIEPPTPRPAASTETPKGTVLGRILVHPAGYGFVEREDGEDNVFIAARYRGGSFDGDRVLIKTWQGYRGPEGRVVEIVSRGRAKLTGLLNAQTSAHGRSVTLLPDDPRLEGPVLLTGPVDRAWHGLSVLAEIVGYPERTGEPLIARLLKPLGPPDDPRTEVLKVLACEDIPQEFPPDVLAEAARAPICVLPEDLQDRTDLRHLAFLTIDPETARDFDDAICIEDGPSPRTTRLWVAVADVSHYVRPGSPLTHEAERRGVSVYLPDRAIAMLPAELSSGICSLNPGVDRLAMVVRIDLRSDAHVLDTQFMAAVIRSRARLDYAGVAAALAGDLRGSRSRYRDHLPQLERMLAVSTLLRTAREQRGILDFDLPEAQVQLDEDDPLLVRDVKRSRATPEVRRSYAMVEDFMLAANEAVAAYFAQRELDTLWRVHAPPQKEALARLAELARSFGLELDPEEGREPRRLREFLIAVRQQGTRVERALSYLLLRSLKQAIYSVNNIGHFGLAAETYLHFTSPIRRYPDLIVHRLLKAQLRLEGKPAGHQPSLRQLPREDLNRMAQESSKRERRAMDVERQVVDMYRAYLMREHVGEEFDGTVAGVTATGLFVEIDSPYVEGLVRTDSLSEPFEFDERTLRLHAPLSGRQIGLGARVRVRIDSVSVSRRRIELSLIALLDGAEDGGEAVAVPMGEPRRTRPRPAHAQGAERSARGKTGATRSKSSGPGRGKTAGKSAGKTRSKSSGPGRGKTAGKSAGKTRSKSSGPGHGKTHGKSGSKPRSKAHDDEAPRRGAGRGSKPPSRGRSSTGRKPRG
jgi:ribonuclease R